MVRSSETFQRIPTLGATILNRGSNLTLAINDEANKAFEDLKNLISSDGPIFDIPFGSRSWQHNVSVLYENVDALPISFSFAWYKDKLLKMACSNGPCALSLFNIDKSSEGLYELIFMLNASQSFHNILMQTAVRISGNIIFTVIQLNDYIYILDQPFSRSKPVYSTVTLGSSLYLHIKPEGYPEPSLQWFKNGFLLPGRTQSVLHFESVDKSDEGTYTCELRNIAGTFIWQEGAVAVRIPLNGIHNQKH